MSDREEAIASELRDLAERHERASAEHRDDMRRLHRALPCVWTEPVPWWPAERGHPCGGRYFDEAADEWVPCTCPCHLPRQ